MRESNPAKILARLNRQLDSPAELTLYGRAALVLGFPESQPDWEATMDVDAILPTAQLAAIEADTGFWDALERVNEELEQTGLYFTHLFEDSQVILRPDWLSRRVEICRGIWPRLRLFRPATADLILSKMMRVDPLDRNDIEFLLRQSDLSREELDDALRQARIPPVPEIEQAFEANRRWLESYCQPDDRS